MNRTEIIFKGNIKEANKFFKKYIKAKGYSKKDITILSSGNKKIGSITTKDLIKLDI